MTVTCYRGRTAVLSLHCETLEQLTELTALWQNLDLAVTFTFDVE